MHVPGQLTAEAVIEQLKAHGWAERQDPIRERVTYDYRTIGWHVSLSLREGPCYHVEAPTLREARWKAIARVMGAYESRLF